MLVLLGFLGMLVSVAARLILIQVGCRRAERDGED